jgi:hypothetical protein
MAFGTGFVIEDGTGLDTATSLVSVSDFRAYWTARPLDAGSSITATDAKVQDALMAATRYICSRGEWQGSPIRSTQRLALPRYWGSIGGRYWTGLPNPILEAVCLVARFVLDESLDAPLDRGGEVQSEQLGPLSTSYFEGAPARKKFASAMDLIEPFLVNSGGQVEIALG